MLKKKDANWTNGFILGLDIAIVVMVLVEMVKLCVQRYTLGAIILYTNSWNATFVMSNSLTVFVSALLLGLVGLVLFMRDLIISGIQFFKK